MQSLRTIGRRAVRYQARVATLAIVGALAVGVVATGCTPPPETVQEKRAHGDARLEALRARLAGAASFSFAADEYHLRSGEGEPRSADGELRKLDRTRAVAVRRPDAAWFGARRLEAAPASDATPTPDAAAVAHSAHSVDTVNAVSTVNTVDAADAADTAPAADTAQGETSEAIWYSGAKFTRVSDGTQSWSETAAPSDLDAALRALGAGDDLLRPLADLLSGALWDPVLAPERSGGWVSLETIGKKKCDRLVYSQKQVDWQLWIEEGASALPCQLMLVYKGEPGPARSSLVFRDWSFAPAAAPERFTPAIPAGYLRNDTPSPPGHR